MIKAKKYDWKDSNMANFGSKEERHVKKNLQKLNLLGPEVEKPLNSEYGE